MSRAPLAAPARLALAPALAPALALALAAPGWAAGPLEKNHPPVEAGTERYEQGEYQQALEEFDAAAADRPQDPRVQYDRGLALYKLGRNEDARAALRQAAELDRDGSLKARIHYNLGSVEAAAGDAAQAVKELRTALRLDPTDEQARHNLEVLLKKLPPKQKSGPDGGTPDGGTPDGGTPDAGRPDGGSDGGRPDGGSPDGGGDAGTGGDGGAGDGGHPGDAGQPGQPQPGDGGADGGQAPPDAGATPQPARLQSDGGVDVSRSEAEKLLDALKNNEKNLQLWRFRQKTPREHPPHAKDW
jgi:tetratricopeptide (TPR) repeat protein